MISLPERNSDAGVESRVLLAECKSPAYSDTYTLELASECMQLMDAVLRNRLANPSPYGAKGAISLADVVKAKGQFAGFGKYPNYDETLKKGFSEPWILQMILKTHEAPPTVPM